MTRECPVCGREYKAMACRLRQGKQTTCSRKCSYEFRVRTRRNAVELVCIGCGTTFTRRPCHVKKSRFCTRRCRDLHRVGDLHPQFLGGGPEYRGPNWLEQRRRVIERDGGRCQTQGCEAVGTDVHHRIPFREFESYREANDLSNLVLLCRPCHRRSDAELQAKGGDANEA